MGEHASYNKGTPYHGSAGVPFIIRYPRHISKGKIIKTAYSSPDFAPTILSLMGVNHSIAFQGIDGSNEILSKRINSKKTRSRFIIHPKDTTWVAVVDRHYKLVLARVGEPWLFDMKEDPHEVINYAAHPSHSEIMAKLQTDLLKGIEKYKLPIVDKRPIYMNQPACYDTSDQIPALPYHVCNDMKKEIYANKCDIEGVRNFCADTCGICCEDSSGYLLYDDKLQTCSDFVDQQWACEEPKISAFCPITCSLCTPSPSTRPSLSPFPSKVLSTAPTPAPTTTAPTQDPTTTAPNSAPTIIEPTCKDSTL